ncbi:MAG: ankyrin repeat domain-containing protein [Parachlamydia sp.]|nr:ankyrin repeat domain-containing protein [Parachlamydia sp.]
MQPPSLISPTSSSAAPLPVDPHLTKKEINALDAIFQPDERELILHLDNGRVTQLNPQQKAKIGKMAATAAKLDLTTVFQLLGANYRAEANFCKLAAAVGRLDLLQWAKAKGFAFDNEVCAAAAAGGHIPVLAWLRQVGCPWDDQTCIAAIHNGHFELLQWAVENGAVLNRHILQNSPLLINNRQRALEWIRTKLGDLDTPKYTYGSFESAYHAALTNDLDQLKDAVRQGHHLSDDIIPYAAQIGNIEMMKWAREKGAPWGTACSSAASQGQFKALKWLRDYGCPWTPQVVEVAYSQEIKDWTIQHGAPQTKIDRCMDAPAYSMDGYMATLNNNLPALRAYKREMGGGLTSEVVNAAAEHGSLEMVQWLSENQAQFKDIVYSGPAREGRLDVIKWLYDRGTKINDRALIGAFLNRQYDALDWLLRHAQVRMTYYDFQSELHEHTHQAEAFEWLNRTFTPVD